MEDIKRKKIEKIVDDYITDFAKRFEKRHRNQVDKPDGVINAKKNNIFIAEFGDEFMFYSAFVRSFDSSFGNVLQKMANSIASLSYEVKGKIESYLLEHQSGHIEYLMSLYDKHKEPKREHYQNYIIPRPVNITSFETSHETDSHLYNPEKKEHYIIELKSSGYLDNKKARAEKIELLKEYFLLKNKLEGTDEKVRIFLATAYNKFGENNDWKQGQVRQYFTEDELLIGKDYWNFLCDDDDGFSIVFEQYKESANYIKEAIKNIRKLYF